MSDKITTILDERGARYGSFEDNARISQTLKSIVASEANMRMSRKQLPLMYYQKEAIDMILHKIARIISGDPNYADNWDDIAGYAQLGKEPR
jgi:hypothetical protein